MTKRTKHLDSECKPAHLQAKLDHKTPPPMSLGGQSGLSCEHSSAAARHQAMDTMAHLCISLLRERRHLGSHLLHAHAVVPAAQLCRKNNQVQSSQRQIWKNNTVGKSHTARPTPHCLRSKDARSAFCSRPKVTTAYVHRTCLCLPGCLVRCL